MKLSRIMVICFVVVFAWGITPGILKAEEFRIAIVQDGNGSVQAYEPLVAHLAKMGIAVTLVKAPTHQAVARMFSSGEVDAILNGPGIPGSMMVIDGLRERWFSAGVKAGDVKVQQAMTSDRRWN
jgi:ABC-type phosphate/phosphonate transport system substrate-binding protein